VSVFSRNDAVQWWVYTGSKNDCDINELVYGRVVGVGTVWVTVLTQYGSRVRLRPHLLVRSMEAGEAVPPLQPRRGEHRLLCAWCGAYLGPTTAKQDSHGICMRCAVSVDAEFKQAIRKLQEEGNA
jgi:hypothetical protein